MRSKPPRRCALGSLPRAGWRGSTGSCSQDGGTNNPLPGCVSAGAPPPAPSHGCAIVDRVHSCLC